MVDDSITQRKKREKMKRKKKWVPDKQATQKKVGYGKSTPAIVNDSIINLFNDCFLIATFRLLKACFFKSFSEHRIVDYICMSANYMNYELDPYRISDDSVLHTFFEQFCDVEKPPLETTVFRKIQMFFNMHLKNYPLDIIVYEDAYLQTQYDPLDMFDAFFEFMVSVGLDAIGDQDSNIYNITRTVTAHCLECDCRYKISDERVTTFNLNPPYHLRSDIAVDILSTECPTCLRRVPARIFNTYAPSIEQHDEFLNVHFVIQNHFENAKYGISIPKFLQFGDYYYQPVGILMHKGGSEGGHYTTLLYNAHDDGKWILMDDHKPLKELHGDQLGEAFRKGHPTRLVYKKLCRVDDIEIKLRTHDTVTDRWTTKQKSDYPVQVKEPEGMEWWDKNEVFVVCPVSNFPIYH